MTTLKPMQALALAFTISSAGACLDSGNTESTQREITAPKPAEPAPEDSLAKAMPAPSADELAQLVATMQPQKARNGDLRFADARLQAPAAAPLLIDRLKQGRDQEATRHALILALPRTQGDYAAAALELYKIEKDDSLRAALIDAMRLANDAKPALEALSLGLTDSSALVRSRAAFNLGRRGDGMTLVAELQSALSDREVVVQTEAARALGQLGATQAFDDVLPLLSSPSADLRLESVRALARMDGPRAATLPALVALHTDSDERIRTAVGKAQAQGY